MGDENKKEKINKATNLAQGCIAAVLGGDDCFQRHAKDTLDAGDGLCDEEIVKLL